MTAQILDGNALAKSIRSDLKADIEQWQERGFRTPGLAVILVGNDPASEVYVNGKRRDCEEVGLHSEAQHLPDSITQAELEERIAALNEDPKIDGILVQTPLPAHLDEDRIIDAILPHKDVDGFHAYNIGRLALRRPTLRSCTPKGIMRMLTHINAPFKRPHGHNHRRFQSCGQTHGFRAIAGWKHCDNRPQIH